MWGRCHDANHQEIALRVALVLFVKLATRGVALPTVPVLRWMGQMLGTSKSSQSSGWRVSRIMMAACSVLAFAVAAPAPAGVRLDVWDNAVMAGAPQSSTTVRSLGAEWPAATGALSAVWTGGYSGGALRSPPRDAIR